MTEELTIGGVARRAGVRPSAIRYYESVGLLASPPRVGGRRRYDPRVLRQLAVIGVAQQAGFTIAEIKILLHGFDAETSAAARWRALAERKLPEIDALIARAHEMTKTHRRIPALWLPDARRVCPELAAPARGMPGSEEHLDKRFERCLS